MKKIFQILLLAAICLAGYQKVLAQGNMDEALAAEYYQKGEFDKSAALYKKLLDAHPEVAFFYDSYFNSMLQLKKYADLEKDLKKIIKKSSHKLEYQVDLGYVYGLDKQDKKKEETYDDILTSIAPDMQSIGMTAQAFLKREQREYAIKTYERGRKLLKSGNAFTMELANLYKLTGQYDKMFDAYMSLLDNNPYDFETVKDYMQDVVMQDAPYEMLKKILLKKVQAAPDNVAYTEMLNWLFVQRKDFTSAFIQSKALDKRLKEGGRRLVDLARIVADYKDYDLAERIYESVVEQGPEATYYVPAQRGLLDIRYAKITQSAKYTPEDITALIKSYNDFLDKYSLMRPESGEIVLRLAEIEAQYHNNIQGAIDLLQKYIELPGIDNQLVARAKLALGDYSLLNGEEWEATLYYSQVEKMFENAPLGHEAKFRNAKLSFYRGDFAWAEAQLNVLKSSTSELIANDAMQLALLIQENIGVDSNLKPLHLYAEADFLAFKGLYAAADQKLDSITAEYPNHSLADEILMLKATMAVKKKDYNQALAFYTKVYTDYSTDILADDALFKAAELEEQYLNAPDKAKELYEKLILNYQGSVYVVEARNRFRKLRGDAVN